MKKLLLATLALTAIALPSQAGVLLPNTYAREFCSMRSIGVSEEEAMRVATRASYIEGETIKVTIDGVQYDADVVQAMRATRERCPQYL
jgi:hypothetical protein